MEGRGVIVYGINPVLEALRAGKAREIRVSDRSSDRMREVIALAAKQHVPVKHVPVDVLARQARGGVHQGVVADVEEAAAYTVQELVTAAAGPPLLVVLDGIEDPHNLGAILRTCDAAGVDGVIMQSRRSA